MLKQLAYSQIQSYRCISLSLSLSLTLSLSLSLSPLSSLSVILKSRQHFCVQQRNKTQILYNGAGSAEMVSKASFLCWSAKKVRVQNVHKNVVTFESLDAVRGWHRLIASQRC